MQGRPAWVAMAVALCCARPAMAQGLEHMLLNLERENARATIQRDTAALRRLEAPDATFAYPDGTAGTGASDVAAVADGRAHLEAADYDSLLVRVLAPTVAVITGRARVRGTYRLSPGAKPDDISGDYRFIDVWRKRDSRWSIVAEQYTRIGS